MMFKRVLVTGGAGYVGSALIPKLLDAGYEVVVLDLYLYGKNVFGDYSGHKNLTEIEGDLRDNNCVKQALKGCDAVIHLACISNDPSYELDPDLGKSINYDAFLHLVPHTKEAGVKRFIYASSSSVYGIKDVPNVTEDLPLEPLTDYSKFKALCEEVLLDEAEDDFTVLILRPATVCGYAKRLRLDLTVNILTNHAVNNGRIRVFGGSQLRPNIHIDDITDLYVKTLQYPHEKIHKKIFNAGYENQSVLEIAKSVQKVIDPATEIAVEPSDDLRSYHISSKKIADELGFIPKHSVEDAVRDLKKAFDAGLIPDSMTDPVYFNIRVMQNAQLV